MHLPQNSLVTAVICTPSVSDLRRGAKGSRFTEAMLNFPDFFLFVRSFVLYFAVEFKHDYYIQTYVFEILYQRLTRSVV